VTRLGFGVRGDLDVGQVAWAAREAERAGYSSFWLSHPLAPVDLSRVVAALDATTSLVIGIGVVPCSHSSPESIAASAESTHLRAERFILGIGAGVPSCGLNHLRFTAHTLRARIRSQVIIGALGPAGCKLAATAGDGLLLTLVTPDAARRSLKLAHSELGAAARARWTSITYVRVALGEEAESLLRREIGVYGQYPGFRAHLSQAATSGRLPGIAVNTNAGLVGPLGEWTDVTDKVVLRAVRGADSQDGLKRLIDAGMNAWMDAARAVRGKAAAS
jgi:alkanesulfonate monooxygenase SsuD/methylene tetrahydromethanopterin reductase-like flavin-dependent oxidoreductase (luciferase family)